MNTPNSLTESTKQNCPHCGASLLPDADECPSCGQSLCPVCGAAIGADDTCCAACGATFDLACPACGVTLNAGDVRCPNCGAAFQSNVEEALPSTPLAKPSEQLIRKAYFYGIELIKLGVSGPQLETRLINIGLDQLSATTVASELAVLRTRYLRRAGQSDLLLGLVGLIIGGLGMVAFYIAGPLRFNLNFVSGAMILAVAGSAAVLIRGISRMMRNSIAPDTRRETEAIWRERPRPSRFAIFSRIVTLVGLGCCLSNLLLRLATPATVPLITTSAAAMNLTANDLGAGFTLIQENTPPLSDKSIREINLRVFQSNEAVIQVLVGVDNARIDDQPAEDITSFGDRLKNEAQADLVYGNAYPLTIGDRGETKEVMFISNGVRTSGFIAVFIKNNVAVFMVELGTTDFAAVEQHARIIEGRIR